MLIVFDMAKITIVFYTAIQNAGKPITISFPISPVSR